MPKLRTITPEKIDKVKTLLKKHSIRGAAMYAGTSAYTARNIKLGLYDQEDNRLQPWRKYQKEKASL